MDSSTGVAPLGTLSGLLASGGEVALRPYFGDDPILIIAAGASGEVLVRVDTPSATTDTSRFEVGDLKSTQEFVASPFAAIAKGNSLAVRVTKTDRNPFEGWISLGRAGNNDIILTEPCVSKLHMIITPLNEGTWTIHDNASTNGTQINGLPLPPQEPRPLQNGDSLWIGGVSAIFVDFETLVVITSMLLE